MSRSTQYIGLNDYAFNYTKSAVKVETYRMTEGMFDEPIEGKIFHMPDGMILKEVVQVVPWSSGPMLFTCLNATHVYKSGQTVDFGNWFTWMVDPSVKDEEFDAKTGRYYV